MPGRNCRNAARPAGSRPPPCRRFHAASSPSARPRARRRRRWGQRRRGQRCGKGNGQQAAAEQGGQAHGELPENSASGAGRGGDRHAGARPARTQDGSAAAPILVLTLNSRTRNIWLSCHGRSKHPAEETRPGPAARRRRRSNRPGNSQADRTARCRRSGEAHCAHRRGTRHAPGKAQVPGQMGCSGRPAVATPSGAIMPRIAIIGAGITGVTSAYVLRKQGYDVSVYDRQRYPAMETSYANGGQLSASNAEVWNSAATVLRVCAGCAATRRCCSIRASAGTSIPGCCNSCARSPTTAATPSPPPGWRSRRASTCTTWPRPKASTSTWSGAASRTSTTTPPASRPRDAATSCCAKAA